MSNLTVYVNYERASTEGAYVQTESTKVDAESIKTTSSYLKEGSSLQSKVWFMEDVLQAVEQGKLKHGDVLECRMRISVVGERSERRASIV